MVHSRGTGSRRGRPSLVTLDPELREALDQVPDHLRQAVAAILEDAQTTAHHAPANSLGLAVQCAFVFAAATDMATDRDVKDQLLVIALNLADRFRFQVGHIVPLFVPDTIA